MTKYLLPHPAPLKNPHSPFRNFNYIRPIHIKGSTKDLRDYQVKIILNKNNFPLEKCKSDGSDIRFKDETGEALPYWIESWSANEAIIWCKVPFIPANKIKDIWIIYGNPVASSESDGDATFEFFDDFTASDIPIDYFTDGGRGEATYCIISPHGTHYGDKTFIVWQGVDLDPYAIEYNHTTETWSSEHKVGTNPLGSDSHGCPSILRDSSGYLHVFYGCHGKSGCSGDDCYIQHAKSTNTDDISSWTDKGNIGPSYATYPNPVLVSSDIYVIFRRMAGSDHFVEAFIKSTDGGENWGASTDIIDFGGGYAIYLGNVEREGTSKIHLAWCYLDYSVGKRLNVYHAYLNLSDFHLYSMDGTDLGTTITKDEADTYCLVYSSGGAATNFPKVRLDSSGTPYIIFVNDDSGAKFKYTKWNGSSWDTPTVITSTDDVFNSHDFYVHSSSNIELYLIGSGLSGRGGDVEKWTFDGSSWTKVATIISESSQGKPLNNPVFVYNFDSDLKVVFSEAYGGGTDYTTPQKVFAYGDSGFVQSIKESTLNTDIWTVRGNATVSAANSIATVQGTSDASWGHLACLNAFSYGKIYEMKVKVDIDDGYYNIGLDDRAMSGSVIGSGLDRAGIPEPPGYGTVFINQRENDNSPVSRTLAIDVWRIYTIVWLSDKVKHKLDYGVDEQTITSSIPLDNMSFIFWVRGSGKTIYVEWVRVRKYISQEPLVLI